MESAVFGLPDDDFGEVVSAAVVPNETLKNPDKTKLIDTLRKELAPYKIPKKVFWVKALPKNAMGKTRKTVLIQMFRPT